MTESENSILFKTENNRLRKMMGSCEEQGPTSMVQQRLKILSKLIEDLERPKLTFPA